MKKYRVTLTADEREQLTALIASGKAAAKKLTHARILLKADSADGGPADRIGRGVSGGGGPVADRAERAGSGSQLAIHDHRRPDQTPSTLPRSSKLLIY